MKGDIEEILLHFYYFNSEVKVRSLEARHTH